MFVFVNGTSPMPITDKASSPTIEKSIQKADASAFASTDYTHGLGDVVRYRIVVTLPDVLDLSGTRAASYPLEIADMLPAGLTLLTETDTYANPVEPQSYAAQEMDEAAVFVSSSPASGNYPLARVAYKHGNQEFVITSPDSGATSTSADTYSLAATAGITASETIGPNGSVGAGAVPSTNGCVAFSFTDLRLLPSCWASENSAGQSYPAWKTAANALSYDAADKEQTGTGYCYDQAGDQLVIDYYCLINPGAQLGSTGVENTATVYYPSSNDVTSLPALPDIYATNSSLTSTDYASCATAADSAKLHLVGTKINVLDSGTNAAVSGETKFGLTKTVNSATYTLYKYTQTSTSSPSTEYVAYVWQPVSSPLEPTGTAAADWTCAYAPVEFSSTDTVTIPSSAPGTVTITQLNAPSSDYDVAPPFSLTSGLGSSATVYGDGSALEATLGSIGTDAVGNFAEIPQNGVDGANGIITINLKNDKSIQLPLTGIFSTNWQYFVGGALAIIAIAGLAYIIVKRKRVAADAESADETAKKGE